MIRRVPDEYLTEAMVQLRVFYDGLIAVGDAGTDESMLTQQLFAVVAQGQILVIVIPENGAAFLLLDGFGEAIGAKAEIVEFIESLAENEPVHFINMSTRPGCLGSQEVVR